jgi:hypothetical protein
MDFGKLAYVLYYNNNETNNKTNINEKNYMVLITHDKMLANIAILCGVIVVKTGILNRDTVKNINRKVTTVSKPRSIEVLLPPSFKDKDILLERYIPKKVKTNETNISKESEKSEELKELEMIKEELEMIKKAYKSDNGTYTSIKKIIGNILPFSKTIITKVYMSFKRLFKSYPTTDFAEKIKEYVTEYKEYIINIETNANSIEEYVTEYQKYIEKIEKINQQTKNNEYKELINEYKKLINEIYTRFDFINEYESINAIKDDIELIGDININNNDYHNDNNRNNLIQKLSFLRSFNISDLVKEYYEVYDRLIVIQNTGAKETRNTSKEHLGNIIERIKTQTTNLKGQTQTKGGSKRRLHDTQNDTGELNVQDRTKRIRYDEINELYSQYLLHYFINKEYERLSLMKEENELIDNEEDIIKLKIIELYQIMSEVYDLYETIDINTLNMETIDNINSKIEFIENIIKIIEEINEIGGINNLPEELSIVNTDFNNLRNRVIENRNKMLQYAATKQLLNNAIPLLTAYAGGGKSQYTPRFLKKFIRDMKNLFK